LGQVVGAFYPMAKEVVLKVVSKNMVTLRELVNAGEKPPVGWVRDFHRFVWYHPVYFMRGYR